MLKPGTLKDLPTTLKTLDLARRWGTVTDGSLHHLSDKKNLESLSLSRCPEFSGIGLQYLSNNLKQLDLQSCINLEENNLRHLPQNLIWLRMSVSPDLTDRWLEKLPTTLKGLDLGSRKLSISPTITGEGLRHLPTLRSLDLASCKGFSKESFRHLKSLTWLSLKNNLHVTDEWISHIPKTVTFLDLSGCNKITGKCIETLNQLPNLKELVLADYQIVIMEHELKKLKNIQRLFVVFYSDEPEHLLKELLDGASFKIIMDYPKPMPRD